jgi:TolB-like protein
MSQETTQPRGFLDELRRRHVVRTAVGYAAVVFVLLQLGEIILPAFFTASQYDALIRLLVVGAVLFSPIVLLVAWVYEITPMGIRSMAELDEEAGHGPTGQSLSHRLAFLIATIVAMGGAGTWWWSTGDMPDVAGLRGAGVFQGVRSLSADGPIGSIAVLPLEDLATASGQEYFAPGMHEALISELSTSGEVRVASRTSVVQYDMTGRQPYQIGADLGVDALVTGSVLRADGQVRISAQLIHAASGTQLWSQSYVRDLQDVIALQGEVARAITLEIRRRLEERAGGTTPGDRLAGVDGGSSALPAPPAGSSRGPVPAEVEATGAGAAGAGTEGTGTPVSATVGDRTGAGGAGPPGDDRAAGATRAPVRVAAADASGPEASTLSAAAQEKLMQGRMILLNGDGADPRRAQAFFQEILEEDSTFVPALTGLASTIFVQGLEAGDLDQLEEARVRALEALGVDPGSMDAIEVLQGVEDAMMAVRGMAAAEPAEGWTMEAPSTSLGRLIHERVAAVESRGTAASDDVTRMRGFTRLIAAGDLDRADDLGDDLLDDGVDTLYLWEAMEQVQRLEQDAADLLELRALRADVRGREPGPGLRDLYFRVEERGEEGYWSWKLEELTARQAEGASVPWSSLATARLATGDEPGALEALQRAVQAREPGLVLLRHDPIWDELRADDRFQVILRPLRERRPPAPRPDTGFG